MRSSFSAAHGARGVSGGIVLIFSPLLYLCIVVVAISLRTKKQTVTCLRVSISISLLDN